MSCACSAGGVGATPEAVCCHFGVTGREPYPTAVEREEVRLALRTTPLPKADPPHLPLAELRACPLLSPDERCPICARATLRLPHVLLRRIADLSAALAPRDPGPRPLMNAIVDSSR